MSVFFVGAPDIYYESLIARAREEFKGSGISGISLKPTGGAYNLTRNLCLEAVKSLECFVHGDSLLQRSQGLSVVIITRPWESESLEELFYPFSIARRIRTVIPEARGKEKLQAQNITIKDALDCAKSLERRRKTIREEIGRAGVKSPLLLPERNFSSNGLTLQLRKLARAVSADEDVALALGDFLANFSHIYPLRKVPGTGRVYEDDRGIWFKLPGRDLHGKVWEMSSQAGSLHWPSCYLNARLRLGVLIPDGFHFDCTRKGSPLAGQFPNCHDAVQTYNGGPHLNIYPNDFIRC